MVTPVNWSESTPINTANLDQMEQNIINTVSGHTHNGTDSAYIERPTTYAGGSITSGYELYNILIITNTTSIHGISGGYDGRILYILNVYGNSITFKHESGSSAAADRFTTSTSADVVSTARLCVLVYDGTNERWIGGTAGNL